jgi:hypothetical protein
MERGQLIKVKETYYIPADRELPAEIICIGTEGSVNAVTTSIRGTPLVWAIFDGSDYEHRIPLETFDLYFEKEVSK